MFESNTLQNRFTALFFVEKKSSLKSDNLKINI